MDYRILGCSGLKVSAITFGTATFGGTGELAMGLRGPRHRAPGLLYICLDAIFMCSLGEATLASRHRLRRIAVPVRPHRGPAPRGRA
jgi:hypothetical protein